MLDDSANIRICISKVNKSMGALSFIWNSLIVQLDSKIKLYLAITAHLALWNGESGNQADLVELDSLYHKAIRRTLGIRMKRVTEEHMQNYQIQIWFGNV